MTDTRRILSEHRRAVWLIAAGLLLNVALFALVVYPLSRKVEGGESQAQGAATELASARAENHNAKATVAGKGQADAELKKFYSEVLPPDLSGARRIMYVQIHQLAAKSNLTYVRDSFDVNQERRETALGKMTMEVTVSGEYSNVRRFIHALENSPQFLVLESVALTQASGEGRALNLVARVSTYFRSGGNGA